MLARLFLRVALAAVLPIAAAPAAVAHGGGHGGVVFRGGGGFRGGFGPRGGVGVGAQAGRFRGLPPVAGVIHERAGARPTFSAYGHTDTAARLGGFGRGGAPLYGHTGTALPLGGARPYAAGYGHIGTGLRLGALGEGRRRLAERRGFGGFGGGFGGLGGFGGGFGGSGAGDGFAGGTYGNAGTYGGEGTYGAPGAYGGEGTYGTPGTYGSLDAGQGGGGIAYRSEEPLAARYAEPPLAPSPGAPYSPDDRYAYAASEDVGAGPRVLHLHHHAARPGCACAPRAEPVIYRYGIGTAY